MIELFYKHLRLSTITQVMYWPLRLQRAKPPSTLYSRQTACCKVQPIPPDATQTFLGIIARTASKAILNTTVIYTSFLSFCPKRGLIRQLPLPVFWITRHDCVKLMEVKTKLDQAQFTCGIYLCLCN